MGLKINAKPFECRHEESEMSYAERVRIAIEIGLSAGPRQNDAKKGVARGTSGSRAARYNVCDRSPLTNAVIASGSTPLPNATTLKSSPISASDTSF